MPRIRRLFIANRGEIAVRIARTAHAYGISVVGGTTAGGESDGGDGNEHDLLHLGVLDASVPLTSWSDPREVLRAAQRLGADALHPGYGFLSEHAGFARAVAQAGITFVGPSAEAIARMADKGDARRLAQQVGVPCIPGREDIDPPHPSPLPPHPSHSPPSPPSPPSPLLSHAEEVGYPLFVKLRGGGGGRGIIRVDHPDALAEAIATAQREGARHFDTTSVMLERIIPDARHIEVQLLGDTAGNVLALSTRECSVQRRKQKLVEEAPAPISAPIEARLIHDAQRLVAALAATRPTLPEQTTDSVSSSDGYAGAATVEFLLDREGNHYFLEVNTRIQVEHPVTEAIYALAQVVSPAPLSASLPASEPSPHPARVVSQHAENDLGATPARGTPQRLLQGMPVASLAGIDIVHLQLAIAEGANLIDMLPDAFDAETETKSKSKTQQYGTLTAHHGHAIEARIVAESIDGIPRSGNIYDWRWSTDTRVDTALGAGLPASPTAEKIATAGMSPHPVHAPSPTAFFVSSRFDSMIAKVIAWGATRDAARQRLYAALQQTAVYGLPTNLPNQRALLADPLFITPGGYTTDQPLPLPSLSARAPLLDDTLPLDDSVVAPASLGHVPWQTAIALAGTIMGDLILGDDPLAGWRVFSPRRVTVRFMLEGVHYTALRHAEPAMVTVCRYDRHHAQVVDTADVGVQGITHPSHGTAVPALIEVTLPDQRLYSHAVGWHRLAAGRASAASTASAAAASLADTLFLSIDGFHHAITVCSLETVFPTTTDPASDKARPDETGRVELVVPMNGTLVSVHKKVGDFVAAGETLGVVEAMKMEHLITAPVAGVVAEVAGVEGDTVRGQAALFVLDSSAGSATGATGSETGATGGETDATGDETDAAGSETGATGSATDAIGGSEAS